jgi:peroxiredoxin|uniref:Alkyl hydroperoxide reductase subunit C/ Thiol specific antioxidant domain-containing protein n=1 Tax=Oryza rufipogon TaxID=4529 RepID=A0A0E0MW03_ORYRU
MNLDRNSTPLRLSPPTSPPQVGFGTTFLKWLAFFAAVMRVLLLSHSNGELAHALGVELDLPDKPAGHDVRSRCYAFLVEDGVVKVLNLKEGVAFTTSSIEEMLKAL